MLGRPYYFVFWRFLIFRNSPVTGYYVFVITLNPAFPRGKSNTIKKVITKTNSNWLLGYYGKIKNRRKTKEYGLMCLQFTFIRTLTMEQWFIVARFYAHVSVNYCFQLKVQLFILVLNYIPRHSLDYIRVLLHQSITCIFFWYLPSIIMTVQSNAEYFNQIKSMIDLRYS